MKIDRRNPRHWWLLLSQGVFTLCVILFRPLLKRPQKPVVLLYGHQLAGNLAALYREWEDHHRSDFKLFYLSLDPAHADKLEKQGISVLRCYRLSDAASVARSSVLISDHGLHLMAPLLFLTSILFVDVWHGIPYKGFTPQDFRLQRRYRETWVSSSTLASLYVTKFGFDADKVQDLGYARTDRLFRAEEFRASFKENMGIPHHKNLVLYAPTWQQDDNGRELFPFGESQTSFLQPLAELCEKHDAVLVVRSHQNSSIDPGTCDNTLYAPQMTAPDTEDLLLATDVLICDWSSIAFDFLALNRPTLFVDVPPPFRNGFSLGPEYRFGAVSDSMDSFIANLQTALAHPDDFLRNFRSKYREVTTAAYGENTDGFSARRQWRRIATLIANQQ